MKKPEMGRNRLGNNNPNWVGDKIKKKPVHSWVRRYLTKPELCEMCKIRPAYDLANVTGIYSRDLNNWKYYCRKCHMISDGRIGNLKQYTPVNYHDRYCNRCSRKYTRIRKSGTPIWFKEKDNDKWFCDFCYQKEAQRLRRKRLREGGDV